MKFAPRYCLLVLCYLLLPLFGLELSAQTVKQAKLDSLQTLLAADAELTPIRVDRLNELGYENWIIDPGASIELGRQALEIAKVLDYAAGQAYANRVIGVAHWAQGNSDLAYRYLIEARKGYGALGDSLGVANSSLNLGMAYADQRNFVLARENYADALRVFRTERADGRIATTYTKIADLQLLQNELGPAFDYLNDALVIHRRNNFLYGIAEVNRKLGQLAAAQEEWDNAISYFLLAVEAGRQRNDQVGLAENYLGIGQAYLSKGATALAEDYLDRAKTIAELNGLQRIRRDLYASYSELERRRGNYRRALDYAEAHLNVRDSLFNREKSNLIAGMEARRAFEAREEELLLAQKDLDLLQQQRKISRLTMGLLALGLVLAVAIFYTILARKDGIIARKGADLQAANRRSDDLETQLMSKEQELTSYTLNFVQKNEGIVELKRLTETLGRKLDQAHRAELRTIAKKLNGLLKVDEDWADFRRHFESVHPDLMSRLGEAYPGLTSNEFRLIALIRLNLSTKEISSVLGISPDSVKTARYRLRKKLDLTTQDNLFDFLLTF